MSQDKMKDLSKFSFNVKGCPKRDKLRALLMGLCHQKNLHANIRTMATLAAHVTFNVSDFLSLCYGANIGIIHTFYAQSKQIKPNNTMIWMCH